MDILNKYAISLMEHKNGSHHFEFEIDAELFGSFEEDEIKKADVLACIDMNRSGSDTELLIKLSGTVTVECDRCLDDLEIPIKFKGKAKALYDGAEAENEEEDIIFFSPEDEMLVLDEYIRESILLCLPTQRIHSDIKECNPQMLSQFKIVSQEEFDNITAQQQQTIGESPEFEKLKALKKEMEKI